MFSQLFSSLINIYSLKTPPTKQLMLGGKICEELEKFGGLGFCLASYFKILLHTVIIPVTEPKVAKSN